MDEYYPRFNSIRRLWSRRPLTALSLLVASVSFIAMPPLGGFWGFLQLVQSLWVEQPGLVGVIVIVNGLTAFSLTRLFCRIFLGKSQPMAERTYEPFWLISLPTIALAVFVCHVPIILKNFGMLPSGSDFNMQLAPLLLWSSGIGIAASGLIYGIDAIAKPIKLPVPSVQNFFAYDFYVQRFYQLTIVWLVAISSRVINWFDRYVVDGLVNLVGFWYFVWRSSSEIYNFRTVSTLYFVGVFWGNYHRFADGFLI